MKSDSEEGRRDATEASRRDILPNPYQTLHPGPASLAGSASPISKRGLSCPILHFWLPEEKPVIGIQEKSLTHAGWTSLETLELRVGESHVLDHPVVCEQSTGAGVLLEWSIPVYFGSLLEPFYSQ